ncbi:unnamed protein product [Prorocentrum cordatum]|uniref:Uncharacterized protein n=1 Tax=Prorocentrum cordatum TaxID=2364126 RepID=A0ABN9SSD5_9DINO|nr:unnamed protein product [Polarella glacialis]
MTPFRSKCCMHISSHTVLPASSLPPIVHAQQGRGCIKLGLQARQDVNDIWGTMELATNIITFMMGSYKNRTKKRTQPKADFSNSRRMFMPSINDRVRLK